MARRALQRSSGSLLAESRCREFDFLLWNWPLVQSLCSVRASWSLASTSRALPLALASAMRVHRDGVGGCLIQIPVRILSSSFAFLWSLAQQSLAAGRSRTAPLLGFASLKHMQVAEVHCSRALPHARSVPPSGFDHPLGGFLRPQPGRLSFTPAALVGFNPSELFPPPEVFETFPPERAHVPFFLAVLLSPKRQAGPPGRDFWDFALGRVPWRPNAGLVRRLLAAPLGLRPSRAFRQNA